MKRRLVPGSMPVVGDRGGKYLAAVAFVLLCVGAVAVPGASARHRHLRPESDGGPSGIVAPRLAGPHPCEGIPGFTCAWLSVPLDHAGQTQGTLRLPVGIQQVRHAERGVLLYLTGGPGDAGLSSIPSVVSRLGSALAGYQLVMFDERGTGAAALQCPELQAAIGGPDLAVPPPGAVAACAESIGPARRYFTTPETVADIEQLRIALGISRLTLDGASYGTYVAERYALTYPHRVARMVLDSVFPQQGVDPLYLAAIQSTARVLRSLCAQQFCTSDPAGDVRAVVRARHNGPQLLDALVVESIVSPSFAGVLKALHAAAAGHLQRLDQFLENIHEAESKPAEQFSVGLRQSTLCLSLLPPWDPDATSTQRASLIARAVGRLSDADVFPFDHATASGNGIVQGCLQWPPTEAPALSDGDPSTPLPAVPVLLLAGDRDLSTPLAWAQEEAAQVPDGRLLIVPGAGHLVQLKASDTAVLRDVARFLAQ